MVFSSPLCYDRRKRNFQDAIARFQQDGKLTYEEQPDLKDFVNIIIKHITDGNRAEERLVEIIGRHGI